MQRNESELGKPHFAEFGNVLFVTCKTDEQRFHHVIKENMESKRIAMEVRYAVLAPLVSRLDTSEWGGERLGFER